MSHKRIPLLVTAIGGGGIGEQILKALTLAEKGRYFIIGAEARRDCPQFGMVDCGVVLPRADDPGYLNAVLDVCAQHSVAAIFPGCEPELKLFSRERAQIAARGILLPINSPEVIAMCLDKEWTGRRLIELGFSPPRYVGIRARKDLEEIDWFPVIVKPSLGAGGSANCYLAQSRRQLMALADYLGPDTLAAGFVVQEYVGTPDEEYTVGVLHDMDGNFINSIAVRRVLSGALAVRASAHNITGRTELGPRLVISSGVSQGYVGRFPAVTQPCETVAAALGVRGPINIQCRLVNGAIKIFEINPRFSGTTSLRALMGYNEPDVLVRKHLMGEAVQTRFGYREGLVLRSLVEHVVTPEKVA